MFRYFELSYFIVIGYVLPDSLTKSWEKGLANDVPVVISKLSVPMFRGCIYRHSVLNTS